MYALERLVREIFIRDKLKKKQFIETLGYQNKDKAYCRIYEGLRTGKGVNDILQRLCVFLDLDQKVFDQAVEKTRTAYLKAIAERERLEQEKQERYERQHFVPHLYIRHTRGRPKQIFIACFLGVKTVKHVGLPFDIGTVSWEQQVKVVQQAIKAHYASTEGQCAWGQFGDITGYLYCQTYDTRFEFTIEGQFIQEQSEVFVEAKAVLKVGSKEIQGGFLSNAIK